MKKFDANTFYPQAVLRWMLARACQHGDKELENNLREGNKYCMTDVGKANRWFGYYQHVGEEHGYWTLEEIIEKVRLEKENVMTGDTRDKGVF